MRIVGFDTKKHTGLDVDYKVLIEAAGRYLAWDDVYDEETFGIRDWRIALPASVVDGLQQYRKNREAAGLDLPLLSVAVLVRGKETARLPVEW